MISVQTAGHVRPLFPSSGCTDPQSTVSSGMHGVMSNQRGRSIHQDCSLYRSIKWASGLNGPVYLERMLRVVRNYILVRTFNQPHCFCIQSSVSWARDPIAVSVEREILELPATSL